MLIGNKNIIHYRKFKKYVKKIKIKLKIFNNILLQLKHYLKILDRH